MIGRPLRKVWLSYGAQLAILGYFTSLEVLKLQLIDRDTYNRTIARCQFSFILKVFAFTFPYGN